MICADFPVIYSTLSAIAIVERVLPLYGFSSVERCELWHRGLSDIYLVETSRGLYVLRVSHHHWRSRTDIDFEVLVEPENNPLVMNNAKQLLPIPKLQPDSKIQLLAFIHLKSPRAYNVKISWVNPNGEKAVTKTFVSL